MVPRPKGIGAREDGARGDGIPRDPAKATRGDGIKDPAKVDMARAHMPWMSSGAIGRMLDNGDNPICACALMKTRRRMFFA